MLDRYVVGSVSRISPEAPVPVLHMEREVVQAGGAANVAANLSSLGAQVSLIGLVGKDSAGERLCSVLKSAGISPDHLLRSERHVTIVKERFMARRQQILRCDYEQIRPLDAMDRDQLLQRLESALAEADVLIVSDYAKGLFDESLLSHVASLVKRRNVPSVVDPKSKDFSRYAGFGYLTPNESEFRQAFGFGPEEETVVRSALMPRIHAHEWKGIAVTRGERGVALIASDDVNHIAGRPVEVFDVIGAGDTFISAFALGLGAGLSAQLSAHLANVAASIVVGKVGTARVTQEELMDSLNGTADVKQDGAKDKFRSLELAHSWVQAAQRAGRRVVFTNGCFDVFHVGHLHLLRAARAHGDALIVALNDDASVERLKGSGRPIHPLKDRAAVLAALSEVDCIVSFSEATPLRLIETLCPDVLVKGADYQKENVVGAEFVEKHGGKVVLVDLVPGRSTSQALHRMQSQN